MNLYNNSKIIVMFNVNFVFLSYDKVDKENILYMERG